jgi:hypothetical protein
MYINIHKYIQRFYAKKERIFYGFFYRAYTVIESDFDIENRLAQKRKKQNAVFAEYQPLFYVIHEKEKNIIFDEID